MIMKKRGFVLAAAALLFFSPLLSSEARCDESSEESWGLTFRAGYFGLPDFILDELFESHPDVSGSIVGGEIRYHGDGGPKGIFSVGLGLDFGHAEGDGIWQEKAGSPLVSAGGEISLAAITLTAYWNIFPSLALHPYFGLGLGAGYAEGTYQQDGEEIEVDSWIPVPHIPVGLSMELGEKLSLAAEARVIGGFGAGAALQLHF